MHLDWWPIYGNFYFLVCTVGSMNSYVGHDASVLLDKQSIWFWRLLFWCFGILFQVTASLIHKNSRICRSFIRSFIHSFIHSFMHSSIHSFIYLFNHSLVVDIFILFICVGDSSPIIVMYALIWYVVMNCCNSSLQHTKWGRMLAQTWTNVISDWAALILVMQLY